MRFATFIFTVFALLFGLIWSVIHFAPDKKPDVQAVEEQFTPCSMPKFKQGEIVETTLSTDNADPDQHWEGVVSIVYENVDPKTKACVYTVIQYNYEHQPVENNYYEFSLRHK